MTSNIDAYFLIFTKELLYSKLIYPHKKIKKIISPPFEGLFKGGG